MRILVTGMSGQLGSELQEQATTSNAFFHFVDSKTGDITNKDQLDKVISEHQIDTIINCAAYTAVDQAEKDVDRAYAVNKTGVKNLVELSEKYNCRLIHISTDYVFDGTKKSPYTSEDSVAPIGVYGKSKQEGEAIIEQSQIAAVTIRTSWVFSSFGKNFVKTMLFHGASKPELRVVDDQYGKPTYAKDLASVCIQIAETSNWPRQRAIYHFANEGAITWCTFAKEIMQQAGIDCIVVPITTAEYPTPAARPAYSVLDTDRIQKDFGIVPRDWKLALTDCLKAIDAQ